ncbi:lysophospholipid acyltransferase family protein [Crateriforma spongiae]|uniref:lysophospholipid acyltransferase family protein n=1 Tax=Crateriforma spongiae TaxID=2724528 RepID=UPI0014472819|nr:lysophospholipid acyltransferase family protein [Crateriforma spongiae]
MQAWKRQATDAAAYLLVRLLVSVVQVLPADMGDRMCRVLAWLLTGPIKIRYRVTRENIRRVFPDATEEEAAALMRSMWHSLLLMGCEIAWAQRRLHLCNWPRHIRFRQNRAMLRILLGRRPTVTVTGHFGNFEIGGYLIGLMGFQTTSIARRLDNQFIDAWVKRFRSAKGQHLVDKEGSAPEVERLLRSGGALSLLADQHAGDKGCWVNFLGTPASCHKALALFTLSSGAPMLAAYTRRIDGQPMRFESGCVGVADPADDPGKVCASVQTLTRWYNARLAEAIDMSVEQYWWLHRRWRQPPPKIAKRLQKAAMTQAA